MPNHKEFEPKTLSGIDGELIVISGVGETPYTRKANKGTLELALDASLAAVADAGLDIDRIDGIISDLGDVGGDDLASNLGLRGLRWSCAVPMGGASAVASLAHAALAIKSGIARHVLIYRSRNRASGPRTHQRPSPLPGQRYRSQLEKVYGWSSPAQRYAMLCRRYMVEYGLTRSELGAVALTMRAHANMNLRAQMYGRTLSLEQYLESRMIADPYCLFDCCLETDGSCALIVSGTRRTSDGRTRQACLIGVAEGHSDPPDDLTNRKDILSIGLTAAAARLWELTSLEPKDMNAAMIYDCFTFQTIHQFEEAGFVPRGEGGAFFASGKARLGSAMPINTHGGSLSEGHMGGLNHVIEAVRQLRHSCGSRQIDNARRIAVTGWGDLGDGSIAVLGQV